MQNEKVPDRTLGGDNDEAHRATFDPSVEPDQAEVDARRSRETAERLADVKEGEVSDVLLARIEPEGRELYAINQSLEKALLLSIAISLCTAAAVPVAETGTSDVDGATDDGIWRDSEAGGDKPVRGKVGLSKSSGGKVGKGRSDKGKSSSTRSSTGVRHWDRPAGPTRGKKTR